MENTSSPAETGVDHTPEKESPEAGRVENHSRSRTDADAHSSSEVGTSKKDHEDAPKIIQILKEQIAQLTQDLAEQNRRDAEGERKAVSSRIESLEFDLRRLKEGQGKNESTPSDSEEGSLRLGTMEKIAALDADLAVSHLDSEKAGEKLDETLRQIAVLREQLGGSNAVTTEYQKEIAEARGRIAVLEEELAASRYAKEELETVRWHLSELETVTSQRLAEHRRKVDEAAEKIQTLERDLAATHAESEENNAKLSESVKQIAVLQEQIASYEAESAERDKVFDEARAKIAALEQQVADHRRTIDESEEKSSTLESDLADARADCEESVAKLEESLNQIGTLQEQLGSREADLAERDKDLEEARHRIAAIGEDLEASRSAKEELEETSAQQIADHQRTIDESSERNSALEKDLAHAVDDCEKNAANLAKSLNEIAALKEQIHSQEAAMTRRDVEFQEARGRIGALEQQLAASRSTEREFRSVRDRLSKLGVTTSQRIADQQRFVEDSNEKIATIAKDLADADTDSKRAGATLDDSLARISVLKSTLKGDADPEPGAGARHQLYTLNDGGEKPDVYGQENGKPSR